MTELKGDNVQLTLAPEEKAVVVQGRIKVQFNGSGGVTVLQNGVIVYPPPANDNAPQAPPVLSVNEEPGKPGWLTKEFLASAEQGQVLPDGSIFIKLKDGSHWAVADQVATPRHCGLDKDLGPVGQWMAEQNQSRVHGHADWDIPNRTVAKGIYEVRNKGQLKTLFAGVKELWLNDRSNKYAWVANFYDIFSTNQKSRTNSYSVCAVRRMEI